MSELELRFPSDQPYAYFAVRGTPEEIQALDFEMLASLYVNTQFAVLKGTASAKDAILGGAQPEPEAPPGDPDAAAQRLAEGRKPRTVPEAEEMARQALKEYAVGDTVEVGGITFTKHSEAADALSEGLGGVTEIDDVNAPPWAGPKPAPKAKPWESEKPKTQVSADDFDF